MSDFPARLKDLLPDATTRLGIPAPDATGRIWASWAAIVGPGMAAHAEPTSLRSGVLKVRVDSPAWATEVGYLADEIRRRVNAAAGTDLVSEVRVWTGPARSGGNASKDPAGQSEKPAQQSDRDPASDPAEALARAHRAWAKRRS